MLASLSSKHYALLLVVAGLIAGIGIGLLLGWQVWPVSWYDTDPSDLRLQHQIDYVQMTADALVVTGDVEAAKRRLYELMDDDTSWEQVSNLVERVAVEREQKGDAAAALRIRRLSQAVQMPQANLQSYEPPQKQVAGKSLPGLLLIAGGVVVLGILAGAWLLTRRNQALIAEEEFAWEGQEAEPTIEESDEAEYVPGEQAADVLGAIPGRPAALRREAPRPAVLELSEEDEEALELDEEVEEQDEEVPYDLPDEEQEQTLVAAPTYAERTAKEWEELLPLKSSPPNKQAGAGELGVFTAEFELGNDDFDASFSIETPDGDFLGECGIGITDVLGGDGPQQVNAFEVWLFDKGDIRTISKILVSEHSYHDPALRDKLSTKGELVLVQPGQAITLQTLALQVVVHIKEASYGPSDSAPNSYFEHLSVEFLADRN